MSTHVQTDRAGGAASDAMPSTAIVLGARNLGAAIARRLLMDGVSVACIARTASDLRPLERDGALALPADASDEKSLTGALRQATDELGPADLIVDAISAARPPNDGSGFGGGPLLKATMAGFDGWTVSPARQTFVTLKAAAEALHGSGGTFVRIIGAPARRADPERGLIAAGSAAVRALTHAAAAELRPDGIHVALLIVDGVIESPKTARMTAGMAPDALVRQQDVAAAVQFLAGQHARGMTHELIITPQGTRWLP